MSNLDERGSKLQRLIYDFTKVLYPNCNVEHEYRIGKLNQRIDIYLPQLGLAIEIDGVQHEVFNSFFFKSEIEWNDAVRRDIAKEDFLAEHGVKLLRIPYNTHIKTPEDLKKALDEIPYPDNPFIPFSQDSINLQRKKEITKELQDKQKETYYSSDAYKEKKKRDSEHRKSSYQEMKRKFKEFKNK